MIINTNKPTLKDRVYRQVIEMICNGQLQSSAIITEKQLTAHFGISKSPVREALIQLCHDHVLTSIPRCGYQVIQINGKDVHDLTELRLLIEVGSLPKLIEKTTPEHLKRLHELNRQRENPTKESDVWSSWNRNVEFHLCLIEGTHNEHIRQAEPGRAAPFLLILYRKSLQKMLLYCKNPTPPKIWKKFPHSAAFFLIYTAG